jgi:hypothetical protein
MNDTYTLEQIEAAYSRSMNWDEFRTALDESVERWTDGRRVAKPHPEWEAHLEQAISEAVMSNAEAEHIDAVRNEEPIQIHEMKGHYFGEPARFRVVIEPLISEEQAFIRGLDKKPPHI